MKKIFVCFVLMLVATDLMAQQQDCFDATAQERSAVPKGGIEPFLKYIYQRVPYTKAARRAKVEGRVLATFVVEKDGSLTQVEILEKLGYGLDEAVVKAIASYPEKWLPARRQGCPVRQRFRVPISFPHKL